MRHPEAPADPQCRRFPSAWAWNRAPDGAFDVGPEPERAGAPPRATVASAAAGATVLSCACADHHQPPMTAMASSAAAALAASFGEAPHGDRHRSF